MGEVIAVVSGKGGAGKTTVCANVAAALALDGHRVLCMDADLGLRNLDIALGMQDGALYHLVDILRGHCAASDAVLNSPRFGGLSFIPASQQDIPSQVSPAAMKRFCRDIAAEYEYILIDCPAGIGEGLDFATAGADRALIITCPDFASVRDADRVADILYQRGIINMRLVINKVRTRLIHQRAAPDIDAIIDATKVRLIGIVPDRDSVIAGSNSGIPVVTKKQDKAAKAFRNIARRITGQQVALMRFR